MKKVIIISSFLVIATMWVSCSARRIESEMTEIQSKEIQEGRLVFKNNCQKCHPNGESGVGPPLNNIHLPSALTKARIRSRAFLLYTGRMPDFKKDEISKKEMKALLAYINTMKKRDPEKEMSKR
ncbi:MAG TPA: cytochrome c [Bacteroidia bacterium]|jgi:mono/diheme cytochrome c family protein